MSACTYVCTRSMYIRMSFQEKIKFRVFCYSNVYICCMRAIIYPHGTRIIYPSTRGAIRTWPLPHSLTTSEPRTQTRTQNTLTRIHAPTHCDIHTLGLVHMDRDVCTLLPDATTGNHCCNYSYYVLLKYKWPADSFVRVWIYTLYWWFVSLNHSLIAVHSSYLVRVGGGFGRLVLTNSNKARKAQRDACKMCVSEHRKVVGVFVVVCIYPSMHGGNECLLPLPDAECVAICGAVRITVCQWAQTRSSSTHRGAYLQPITFGEPMYAVCCSVLQCVAAYCIWSASQSYSPISISFIFSQRNVAKET